MSNTTDETGKAYLLLDTQQTAELIGMSAAWLERDRWYGGHKAPPYVKLGHKVRYKRADVIEWMESLGKESAA
jgi:predicted DNA-binding transcriptional regulator AlpA